MATEKTTSFDDLPQELADNILLRLPVKALIRSTSVNKKWYSLITNPNFISAQIKNAISHCDDNLVLIVPCLISEEKHCSLISVETSELVEKFEVPFTIRGDYWLLVNSVDGLMLLTGITVFNRTTTHLYLWNPCLKTYRILVSSCFEKVLGDRERFYLVGLGFNKVSNDYRVVRIVYFQDNMDLPKVEVYSLRERAWKEIKDPVVPRRSLRDCEGIYVNGRIYWMEVGRSFTVESSPYASKMLSFDFDTEVFGEVKVPEEVSNCLGVGAGFKLMEFDGSLALCVCNIQVRNGLFIIPYRIWLMRLDNGVISWILRFTNELKEPGLVVNITKTGTILVQRLPSLPVHAITRMYSCNLNTMHYKDLGLGGCWGEENFPTMPHCIVDTSFIESLVMYEGGKSLLKFSK